MEPSLALVQQWAEALTSEDWYTARQIRPSMNSLTDDQLVTDYGRLMHDQIVYESGSSTDMHVASVAQEVAVAQAAPEAEMAQAEAAMS